MTFKISNNAVSDALIGGERYVFSFGGIDQTKLYSGITQNSYKYEVSTGTWSSISPLPSLNTNIAAGASTVKNKIYIIGGYHVYANGSEVSSNEVIIYNPTTNTYEPNGNDIPIPIDDHVQCVWRDSLIYVVTGWSNNGNVPNVQLYNPELNSWLSGTDTPNTHDYKSFGASGTIIGDTLYYFGGAKSTGGFNAVNTLRKGVIDENNPTNITWSLESNAPNNGYRSACIKHGNNAFWVGGSAVSYNYNGIAYNGSGGVNPLTQIMRYDTDSYTWYDGQGAPYSVMDMRGIAQISSTSWIICGGMDENQSVTNRTFLLNYDPITGSIIDQNDSETFVFNRVIHSKHKIKEALLYSLSGQLLEIITDNVIKENSTGLYILIINGKTSQEIIKLKL
jgi:N-acetylneuraminic acid mutarotase